MRGARARTGTARQADDRGAVLIIVAVFMLVAMVLMAFVLDRGRTYVVEAQLQNAVDAAALAAAQEFCVGGGDPVGVAQEYGDANGATIAAGDVLTTSQGSTSFVNVRASEVVDQAFGAFAGTPQVTVAAQATASRRCTADFTIVSDTFAQISGTGSTGDGIYAAECFDGGGGDYGIVAVGVAITFDCKDAYSGWPNNVPPIYAGTGGTVETPLYGVSGISVASAALAAQVTTSPGRITVAEADALADSATYPDVLDDCDDVDSDSMSDGASVDCTNDSKTLNVPNGTVAGDLIAEGDIVLDNTTVYTGRLIYSRDGDIVLKGDIGAQAIVYAPNGTVTINGSTTIIRGQIFAEGVEFNGGGQGVGDTTLLPAPGPFQLIH